MTWKRPGGAAILVAAAIVAFVLWRGRAAGPAATSGRPAAVTVQRSTTPSASSPGVSSALVPQPTGRLDPSARARLTADIAAARARRSGTRPSSSAAASAGGPPGALAAGALDKDYVRTQIRELIPMLSECYEQALEGDPAVAGKLVVEFTIGGEPEVGGMVETSEIVAGDSTITHAGMIECVRETMYGAEFVAPGAGGQATVRYPFAFQPGDDGG